MVSTPVFKVGDRVICVNINKAWPIGLVVGRVYDVDGVKWDSTLKSFFVRVAGLPQSFYESRFKLVQVQAAAEVVSKTDPTKPYDYGESDEDRERKARTELLKYKKGMRDFLYGTTSED